MKKLLILLVLIFALAGCGGNSNNRTPDKSPSQAPSESPAEDLSIQGTVDEYVPFLSNTMYKYSGNSQFSDQTVYTVFLEGNKMQRRVTNMDFISTEVLEKKDGELRLVFSEAESNGFENFMEREGSSAVILKEPLQLNNSWERVFTSANPDDAGLFSGKSTITAVNVPIKTKAGDFEAIEVTTEFDVGLSTIEYYAKGAGLVKSISTYATREGNNAPVISKNELELEEIEEDSILEVKMDIYFPDDQVMDLKVEETYLKFETNTDISALLEELFKKPSENPHTPIITEHTKINYIRIDREEAKAYLDLSEEFLLELNAGASYESLIRESLSSTILNFYRVSDLHLSVDGVEYTGNH